MSSSNGNIYGFTGLFPIKNDTDCSALRSTLRSLDNHPLGSPLSSLDIVHMARFVIVDRLSFQGEPAKYDRLLSAYLLFTCDFDGSDIDDLVTAIMTKIPDILWHPSRQRIARSNVSNSLRELQSWGIVRVTHLLDDRRDHFESMKDVWEMFRVIVDERRKREAAPTLTMLRDAVSDAKKPGAADAYTRERLAEMLQFFELMNRWAEQMGKLPTPAVTRMVKMGDKIGKLLGS